MLLNRYQNSIYMILSVSRRTDIPAFFGEWFINRLKAGYALTRNPFNPENISRIRLDPEVIDCIIFWTKDPSNFLDKLPILDEMGYKYYFHFTITSYGPDLETNMPDKSGRIGTFIRLSEKLGKNRVIWRYDPILLSEQYSIDHHTGLFNILSKKLNGHTENCIISFLDMYKKCVNNLKGTGSRELEDTEIKKLAEIMSGIAGQNRMELLTCAEEIDLSNYGIEHAKCIDDRLISNIIGEDLHIEKDKHQRKECGCVKSIDIGTYNTCLHNCLYCYANYSRETVLKNNEMHDPESPLLIGNITDRDVITERDVISFRIGQTGLF
ncbi:DUF1848 domain-containing protein [candidate division KSB1 bacterium]